MFVIAVTGGIGAGKTFASGFFAERGAVVIDLDALAKELLESCEPARDAVLRAFGDGVRAENGGISRERLAAAAFSSQDATRRLNSVVHPIVSTEVSRRLDELALAAEPPRLVVLDVPLLVEAPDLRELADHILSIEAAEDVRIARAVTRGMSEAEVRRRLARQSTDAERAATADTVIRNDGTPEGFSAALADFWEREVAPRVS